MIEEKIKCVKEDLKRFQGTTLDLRYASWSPSGSKEGATIKGNTHCIVNLFDTGAFLRVLAAVKENPKITSLRLMICQNPCDRVIVEQCVCILKQTTNVVNLDFTIGYIWSSSCKIDCGVAGTLVSPQSHLVHLTLAGEIADNTTEKISCGLRGNKTLKSLTLRFGMPQRGSGLKALVGILEHPSERPSALESLSATTSYRSPPPGFLFSTLLSRNTSLTTLILDVPDEGDVSKQKALNWAQGCAANQKLQRLKLRSTNVSCTDGLSLLLAGLHGNQSLVSLTLEGICPASRSRNWVEPLCRFMLENRTVVELAIRGVVYLDEDIGALIGSDSIMRHPSLEVIELQCYDDACNLHFGKQSNETFSRLLRNAWYAENLPSQ